MKCKRSAASPRSFGPAKVCQTARHLQTWGILPRGAALDAMDQYLFLLAHVGPGERVVVCLVAWSDTLEDFCGLATSNSSSPCYLLLYIYESPEIFAGSHKFLRFKWHDQRVKAQVDVS